MADVTNTPDVEGTTTADAGGTNEQTAPMEPSGSGGEQRTFSQADVDRIVRERLSRAKHEPPADYEEFKAKAAKYDELAEAQKSDLEKANDAATKAKAEADEWRAKYEALESEQERQRAVAEMAAQYKVDAGTLARMAGDVEENAKYLAGIEAARPKYPTVTDNGDTGRASVTKEEILAEKDTQKRQRLIAENISLFK